MPTWPALKLYADAPIAPSIHWPSEILRNHFGIGSPIAKCYRQKNLMRTTTWLAAFLLLAASLCNAQQVIKHGSIEVNFPTSSWIETEPPTELTAVTNLNPQLNIDFHAISQPAELRLLITRLEYPVAGNGEVVAGYLSGARRRCQRQAREPIVEKSDFTGKIPIHSFQANLPGGLFLEIRALFCTERVYLLEIRRPGLFS